MLNPLADGLRIEPTPGATTLVIFGASGDLTRRKLLPALHSLSRGQRLPARFSVIGIARSPLGDDGFRQQFHDSLREFAGLKQADEVAASLAGRMYYIQGELDDPATYRTLASRLDEIDGKDGVLYYLAIPPSVYGTVIEQIGAARLSARAADQGWRRIIIEKPFGIDLASARELNQLVHRHFDEPDVFRIDHYLGKETVQNLLVFRFANGMFEPIWNRRYIDHVQITVAETVGVERRGRLLRRGRRAARHGAEPPDAAAGAGRDGAPDRLHRRERPRPQARRRHVDPAAGRRRPRRRGRPGPVRGGVGERAAGARLPRRAGRRRRLVHRDVRGDAAAARQLALGRRPVLPAHRQAAAEAHDRNRDPVQAAAAGGVQAGEPARRSRRTC